MKLNSLIDFLPYEFKDQDTYKVDGKGILERYLEIFGNYFQDVITSNIDNILDIIDIDSTPGYYLNYLWEFLGELPFANTPTISEEIWKIYFAGFKDDSVIEDLCDKWLNQRTGILDFDTDKVRTLLKCSISLFKIRGTKQFFEILFRLYGLGLTIEDPVDENTDLWIPDSHPIYDDEDNSIFDSGVTFDNQYKCEQCVEVPITISGHGFTSITDEFLSFKRSIDALFDRFLPYFAQPSITYEGITINYNYQITAEPTIDPELIQGEIDQIPIVVTVTAAYDDADLRWQVSGDGVNWSSTYYDSGDIYYAKREGTLYFRCVGDNSVITTVVITKSIYIKAYNLWAVVNDITYSNSATVQLPTWDESQSRLTVTVYGTLTYKGASYSNLQIRCLNTGEILNSPAEFTITEAGTYVFQLVDFPVKTWTLTVVASEEFTIVCDPTNSTLSSGSSTTTITATSRYLDNSTLTIMRYMPNSVDYEIGTNPATFTATSSGTYYFYCAEDPDKNLCSFTVTAFDVTVTPVIVDYYNLAMTEVIKEVNFGADETVLVYGNVVIFLSLYYLTYINDTTDSFKDYIVGNKILVRKVTNSGTITVDSITVTEDMIDTNYSSVRIITQYNLTEAGTYVFSMTMGGTTRTSNYIYVTQEGSSDIDSSMMIIEPYNENDSGWVDYEEDEEYPTSLTYKFDDNHTQCQFILRRLDGVTGTATRQDDQSIVTVDADSYITYSKEDIKSGTYTFKLNGVENDYYCYLTIQKETPTYTIYCDPTSVVLTNSVTTASTTVYVTMTPEDTSGEFTWNITVPGLDVTRDAKDGYVFTTQATGEFVFTCVDDPTKTCTFTVTGNTSVQPDSLSWEAESTSSQSVDVTTYDANIWNAEITETP